MSGSSTAGFGFDPLDNVVLIMRYSILPPAFRHRDIERQTRIYLTKAVCQGVSATKFAVFQCNV